MHQGSAASANNANASTPTQVPAYSAPSTSSSSNPYYSSNSQNSSNTTTTGRRNADRQVGYSYSQGGR